MNETKDILTLEDVKKLVDTFYGKVRENDLLAPVFYAFIKYRGQQIILSHFSVKCVYQFFNIFKVQYIREVLHNPSFIILY